ncbi:8209_t:CDS:2, partial [Funneliformis caledonium]
MKVDYKPKNINVKLIKLPHIKITQVPNVVSGVAPIRSLVNLGSGVADLILLPIEQYKKNGRIIRGLQKGTESFAQATTMEAIRFGIKLQLERRFCLNKLMKFFLSNFKLASIQGVILIL